MGTNSYWLTIFGTFDERKIQLIFSFLEGKTTHHSRRFFQIIKQKIGQQFNILHWAPEKIISDFETGLIPAVQTEINNAIHWGCYFHFTQAIFCKIQNSGLQIPYRGDGNLKKNFRKIMSVGFLPLGEIRNAIVDLLDEEPTRTLFFRYPELRDFFQYFQNTWFLTFPPEMWNVFERPSRMRTTNICEGLNSSWNRRTRRGRHNFWLAIRFLKVQERVI